jgi:hypothetical protein
MHGWFVFWTLNFIVAGSAFALIAIIVLVRGLTDMRQMFARLEQKSVPPVPNTR